MSTLKSKKALIEVSLDDANKAMTAYAQATNSIEKIDAELKTKLTALQSPAAEKKKLLAEEQDKAFATLDAYAQSNQHLFEDKKSIELPGGVIGYRRSSVKVVEKEGLSMETILKNVEKWLPDFLKTTKTLNKAVINSKLDDSKVVKTLEKCGLEVEPATDSFYVKVV